MLKLGSSTKWSQEESSRSLLGKSREIRLLIYVSKYWIVFDYVSNTLKRCCEYLAFFPASQLLKLLTDWSCWTFRSIPEYLLLGSRPTRSNKKAWRKL